MLIFFLRFCSQISKIFSISSFTSFYHNIKPIPWTEELLLLLVGSHKGRIIFSLACIQSLKGFNLAPTMAQENGMHGRLVTCLVDIWLNHQLSQNYDLWHVSTHTHTHTHTQTYTHSNSKHAPFLNTPEFTMTVITLNKIGIWNQVLKKRELYWDS